MIIEFSGIDGSGKSTQIHRLSRRAVDVGLPAGEWVLRSTARRICQARAAERGLGSWRELYAADLVEFASALDLAAQVQTTLAPADTPRALVLADQYLRTWRARAALLGPRLTEQTESIYRLLPEPVLSFHLEIDPALSFARVKAREKGDHALIRGGLATLVQTARTMADAAARCPYPCTILDASAPPEQLTDQIWKSVEAALPPERTER